MKKNLKSILNLIAQTIYDKKGVNILALDVQEISTLTDYVIIAEGGVDKHVISIANGILDALHEVGFECTQKEGMITGDWVVLDFLNIMVHLFMPGLRDKYRLEDLWKDGQILDLQISTTPLNAGAYVKSSRK
ncbi:MAG TPA: ribosome silencing factor [Rhabdochlamydiaceae bacterium]|nr:ribosome silencing factor [Rhabdochlamydiaceae bacterium]